MINLKWLLSEQRQYMDGDTLAYENMSVPFAIILGDPHLTEKSGEARNREARRLENNVIAQFLPEYILAEPGIGAWIFVPNKNQVRLRDDEPLDCPEDLEYMNKFLRLNINDDDDSDPKEALQSFLDYNNANVFLDWRDFKLWSIRYNIPLVGCDLCLHAIRNPPEPPKAERDEKILEIIKTYAKKSSKPIIAIIGLNHITSRIHLNLKKENVGCLILRY